MRKILFLLLSIAVSASAQVPKNLSLLGSLNFPGQRLSGCWHYNDTTGKEYAIVGVENGLCIVDITQPATPTLLFQLPGVSNLWHELKVNGNFAYGVSEGSDPNGLTDGMQIIDLRYLPDSAPTTFYHGDGVILNQLTTGHTITVSDNYAYINGHNISSLGRGVLILDISNPISPVYVGAETIRYCHDSYVRGNFLYTSDIQDGMFTVYDITNRSNPVQITTQVTPGQFTHNTWLSDNSQYIFTADERAGTPVGSYDISDLANITLLDTFYNANFTASEIHNVRVFHDFLVNPSYGSQLTIVDASRPNNLIEVGNYPTGTSLCWDADPYTASGNIIATDMTSHMLYIFGPTYTRGCYLEGTVTDSVTGLTLAGVSVDLTSLSINEMTDFSGMYATGCADSGTFSVSFSLSGYFTKQFNVSLSNGILTPLDVQLVPLNAAVSYADSKSLHVYPNPARDYIRISSEDKIHSWRLIDAQGRVVLEDKPDKSGPINISTSSLSIGVYTLEFENGMGKNIRKVVLN